MVGHPQTEYWSQIARHWELLGPPLKPSQQDVAAYLRGVSEFEAPRAAILGVTQEICRMAWPAGSDVIAIDHNADMIHAVWPGRRDRALKADWARLPLRERSRDVILCDGGLSVVPFPSGASEVAAAIYRTLTPGGLALIRVYAPPARQEKIGEVLHDLIAGRVPSLNHLKLLMGMALEAEPGAGVELAAIWDSLHTRAPDLQRLAADLGWEHQHLMAINAYRESRTRYYFPTVAAIRQVFESAGFHYEWTSTPTYPLGERCQVLCWRRARI